MAATGTSGLRLRVEVGAAAWERRVELAAELLDTDLELPGATLCGS